MPEEPEQPQGKIIYEDGASPMPGGWVTLWEGHYVFDAACLHWNSIGHVALERGAGDRPPISVCRLNVTCAHIDLWLAYGRYRIAAIGGAKSVHAELVKLGGIDG